MPPENDENRLLLEMAGIGKQFSGVRVLEDADFELAAGEVHVLAGENGAGKSTLVKVLAGVYDDYAGRIVLGGSPVRFGSPHQAREKGIAVIYQEISLVGGLSVADNLFLGRERTGRAGWLDRRSQESEARKILAGLGLELDVTLPVDHYPLGVRQMVEIGRALSVQARVIVMDEPTSSLAEPEVERLFELIGKLKARGCGIIYISHKMEEIYRLADRITVLRDGRRIATGRAAELPGDELVRLMVGREIVEQFPERRGVPGEVVLALKNFSVPAADGSLRLAVTDCSFELRAGEIVGLAGLQGSGNSELLHGIFGSYGRRVTGAVELEGRPFEVRSPAASIRAGLALLTSDRKATGSVGCLSVGWNVSLAALQKFSPRGWIEPAAERAAVRESLRKFRLKVASPGQSLDTLSGGNQQKALLARWQLTGPRVFLLDEPTRGVDVGVKHEIYEMMNRWTETGCAILLITSEMPELLAMSDRILVLSRGRIAAGFSRGEATQEKILHAAMAASPKAA
ncbi:MAG: sugar ABC transporter ATP-binding protein [Candidatus Glassbacteria bacterium]